MGLDCNYTTRFAYGLRKTQRVLAAAGANIDDQVACPRLIMLEPIILGAGEIIIQLMYAFGKTISEIFEARAIRETICVNAMYPQTAFVENLHISAGRPPRNMRRENSQRYPATGAIKQTYDETSDGHGAFERISSL